MSLFTRESAPAAFLRMIVMFRVFGILSENFSSVFLLKESNALGAKRRLLRTSGSAEPAGELHRREFLVRMKNESVEIWRGCAERKGKLNLLVLLVLLDRKVLVFSQPDSFPQEKILVGKKQARNRR